jgi:hypothetical protein
MPATSNVPQWFLLALPFLVIWDLVWRGLALWASARRRQTAWFVCLLILNTLGVLPIIYLLLNRTRGEG